jgi:tRNA G46 methylase TrmB
MRLRNKKWVKQYLQDNENFMINPEEELNAYKVFDSNRDIFLEIGEKNQLLLLLDYVNV